MELDREPYEEPGPFSRLLHWTLGTLMMFSGAAAFLYVLYHAAPSVIANFTWIAYRVWMMVMLVWGTALCFCAAWVWVGLQLFRMGCARGGEDEE